MSELPATRVAIVGAGVMGAGIAQVFADAGLEVAVYDPDAAARGSAPARIATGLALLRRPAGPALSRLRVEADLAAAVEGAQLVVEAASERLDLKQRIFADLDDRTDAGVVLASNTSAFPITAIARDARRPERVIGTHFWNPPYLLPLVEVVQSAATTAATVAWTMRLLRDAGTEPVHVRTDLPGFVGNRLQHALKREAIALVAAGVCDAATVDLVTRHGFGARLGIVGPLEQSDLSGLELTLAIHEVLMPSLDRTATAHPYLVKKVHSGQTGAAVGQGFRRWAPGEADERRREVTRELVAAALRRREERSS
ncbi:MAG: 3-hydroxybutyryl-CoA dehydrogenase [Mycobacteriales bacterium]